MGNRPPAACLFCDGRNDADPRLGDFVRIPSARVVTPRHRIVESRDAR